MRLQRDGDEMEFSLSALCPGQGCQDEAAAHRLHSSSEKSFRESLLGSAHMSAWGNPVKETCATPQGKRTDWYFVRVGHAQTCPAGTAGETMWCAEKRGHGSRIWDGDNKKQGNWWRHVTKYLQLWFFPIEQHHLHIAMKLFCFTAKCWWSQAWFLMTVREVVFSS